VRAIARVHDNLDLNLIPSDGRTFLDNLEPLFFYLGMPFRNTFNRVWIEAILEQAYQQGVRVLLTGDGGNLTFSWNGSGLLMECVRHGQWGRAWREAGAQVRCGHARATWRTFLGQGILPLLPAPLWAAAQRWREGKLTSPGPPWRAYSAIHPVFAAEHRIEERARMAGHDFYFQPVHDMPLMRWQGLVDGGTFAAAYRAMNGVDFRPPTMDQRLVEFCFALPEEQFLREGLPRRLARLVMADRLPSEVLENRKRGLQAADWFVQLGKIRGRILHELVRLERSALARRALDLARVRRLVENWPQGGWGETRMMNEYYSLLPRGLMAGRFILWFEAGCPPP
jgi:asparagine synthase (glutamine-hydrolysing)